MTLEDLKKEAARQGYALIKRNPLPLISPCTCGRKSKFSRWYRNMWGVSEIAIYCPKCEREVWGENEREAREHWNRGYENERRGNREAI